MVKVGIAPCTIFTSTAEDYRRAAQLADEYHVNLQTHLSESQFEQQYAQDKLGMTPLQYLEEQGWVGSAVSFVHGIEIRSGDRHRLQRHQQSIVHCPISNARAPVGQTGLAPVAEFLADEINVSLGVDGSAGNDSSNLMEEMRWARTLAGARKESTYLPVMDVWRMGTINGARALQWESTIGSIAVGKCADLCWFDTHDSLAHLGAWDTVGSLLSCQATKADMVMVNGRVLRESGEWVSLHRPAVQKKIQKRWESTFPLEERKKYD
jgi:cytosine/adenosine deaminase-related metal-dependent hydrolase